MSQPQLQPSQPFNPEYDVLICTYNGADYIAEQLGSILVQKPAPAGILVSDDGSTDSTRDIVRQIAKTTDIPVSLIDGPGRGVISNVLSALPKTRSEYVFLADQDDIWLANKAALFCQEMQAGDQPHLIFSDAWVWHPVSGDKQSFWELDKLRPDNARSPQRLAFHNTVQGASACINRALINAVKTDHRVVMHDWWLALIAAGFGKVSIMREPTLLYRQHDKNQIGSQNKAGRKDRGLSHRRAVATRILRQALAYAEQYAEQLPPAQQRFFRAYRKAITGNIIQRGWFVLRHWPKHRDPRHTLSLWASIVLVKGIDD